MKEFEFEGSWRKFVVGDEILKEQMDFDEADKMASAIYDVAGKADGEGLAQIAMALGIPNPSKRYDLDDEDDLDFLYDEIGVALKKVSSKEIERVYNSPAFVGVFGQVVENKGKREKLNEYTDNSFSGAQVISQVNKKGPDMFGQQLFKDLLPQGVSSELDAFNALRAHDQSGIKQRMGRFAPMFVHVQYHEFNHEGEVYRLHQTQYYNSNFKDKDPDFNPGVTELALSKISDTGEIASRIGTILVKTDEYLKDLKNLNIIKRVS